jgi:hypothetical protein
MPRMSKSEILTSCAGSPPTIAARRVIRCIERADLAIEVAGLLVCPAQHKREHPEGNDERRHKKHVSSRHDLLPLLLPVPCWPSRPRAP